MCQKSIKQCPHCPSIVSGGISSPAISFEKSVKIHEVHETKRKSAQPNFHTSIFTLL